MKVNILGVKVDDLSLTDALALVEKWIQEPSKHYIVTPNPEFIVAAQKDRRFRKILNDADLSIPDGVGLKLSGKVKHIFSGTDFMEKLVALASEKGFTVGFLGGRDEVASKTAECLMSRYPNLEVSFANGDIKIDKDGRELESSGKNQELSKKKSDILFVAFGHIKQEKWIANYLNKIPVKIAMGVGGAFDYLSGSIPRAPKRIRDLGLEWLFRLLIQPWRIKRQLALLRYLWLIKGI